jgi:hypothetical protein
MFFTGSAVVSTAPPPKHNAGMAAEAAGDKTKARQYYTTLLKVTDNGLHSTRPEIAHARAFLVTTAAAGK